jgi:hypothetical protein
MNLGNVTLVPDGEHAKVANESGNNGHSGASRQR